MAASLPNDLCALVASSLSRKDNARARSTCSRWRAGVPPPPPYRELEHRGYEGATGATAWSSDGERVAAIIGSHEVVVYETASARLACSVNVTRGTVFAASFARNSDLVLLGLSDSVRVSVFAPDGRPLGAFLLNDPEVYPLSLLVVSASFSRDATALVLTFVNGDEVPPPDVRNRLCWLQLDPATHRPTHVRHVDVRAAVGSDEIYTPLAALSPDGSKLAALSNGSARLGWRAVTVTDTLTSRRVFESVANGNEHHFGLLSWDETSTKIAFVEDGGAVFVIDLSPGGGVCVRHLQNNPHKVVVSCAWSLDRLVLSGRPRSLDDPITFLRRREVPLVVVDGRTGAFVKEISLPRATRGEGEVERHGWCLKHVSPAPDGRAVLGFEVHTWRPPRPSPPMLRLLNV